MDLIPKVRSRIKKYTFEEWYDKYHNDLDNLYKIVIENKNNNSLLDKDDIYSKFLLFLYENSTQEKVKSNYL